MLKTFKKSSFERFISYFSFVNPDWAKKKLSRFYWNEDDMISLKKAPQPSDILWNGIGCRSSLKRKRKINSNIFLVCAFIAQLIFLVFVKVQVRKIQVSIETKWISDSLNLITALIIALFNVFIGKYIRARASFELKSHQTGYFSRVASSLINMFFINMVVIVLAANYFEYLFTNSSIPAAI